MASGNLTTSQRNGAFDKNQNIEKQRQTLMRIVISGPANMAEFNMTCQLTLPFKGGGGRGRGRTGCPNAVTGASVYGTHAQAGKRARQGRL